MNFVYKSIIGLISNFGVYLVRKTTKKDVLNLINKLKPINTNLSLLRLGCKNDGGYLIPNDLSGINYCFSPGVDTQAEFELDCANLGMKVFLADASVESPPLEHNNFIFTKKYIGASNSDNFITIDHWVNNSISKLLSDDILIQMDIEGYEYEVILNMSEALINRTRIFIVEFHNLQHIWNKQFFQIINSAINKILQNHLCVHIHPNNCCGLTKIQGIDFPKVLEVTFIRKDRVQNTFGFSKIPNKLDASCTDHKEIKLSKLWTS